MRRRKVECAFVLAGVLLSDAAGPAMANMTRAECIKLFEAKYESRKIVCLNKTGHAQEDCLNGIKADLDARIAGCPGT
jgi:hypothetical protein